MNQNNMIDVDNYIKQSRNTGASDGQILDELIRAGWDRNVVLDRLSSDKATIPNITTGPAQAFRNNSGLDNVQVVNTKGDSTQSRIGIASYFFAGSILVLGYTVVTIVNSILDIAFSQDNYFYFFGTDGAKYSLVFALSVFVPALIAFLVSYKKLKRTFIENPSATEDIYYKKNVRSSLKVAFIATAYIVFRLGFSIFSVLFLDKKVEFFDYVHNIVLLIGAVIVSYVLWGYSKKTYR